MPFMKLIPLPGAFGPALLALTFALSGPALAQGHEGGQWLSCQLDDGKTAVNVWLEDGAVNVFIGGKARAALIATSQPVAEAAHRPWEGVGRSIFESLTIEAPPLSYEIWISLDRLIPDSRPEGGVNVIRDGQLVASRECLPETVLAGFWVISDAKKAQGICWDLDAHGWASCKP